MDNSQPIRPPRRNKIFKNSNKLNDSTSSSLSMSQVSESCESLPDVRYSWSSFNEPEQIMNESSKFYFDPSNNEMQSTLVWGKKTNPCSEDKTTYDACQSNTQIKYEIMKEVRELLEIQQSETINQLSKLVLDINNNARIEYLSEIGKLYLPISYEKEMSRELFDIKNVMGDLSKKVEDGENFFDVIQKEIKKQRKEIEDLNESVFKLQFNLSCIKPPNKRLFTYQTTVQVEIDEKVPAVNVLPPLQEEATEIEQTETVKEEEYSITKEEEIKNEKEWFSEIIDEVLHCVISLGEWKTAKKSKIEVNTNILSEDKEEKTEKLDEINKEHNEETVEEVIENEEKPEDTITESTEKQILKEDEQCLQIIDKNKKEQKFNRKKQQKKQNKKNKQKENEMCPKPPKIEEKCEIETEKLNEQTTTQNTLKKSISFTFSLESSGEIEIGSPLQMKQEKMKMRKQFPMDLSRSLRYYLDMDNNLMDSENNYILDRSGKEIKLSDDQIAKLQESKLINFIEQSVE